MKYLFVILSLFFASFSAYSKNNDGFSKDAEDGVSFIEKKEARDSAAFEELKNRISEIKKERPSVALVLSGGGAKGTAHVGVLKYLEEKQIPIDVILGTSMGGLVGVLYSLGYGADEINRIFSSINWYDSLTDKIPRKYVSYEDQSYKDKFIFSMPFYYAEDDYFNKIKKDLSFEKENVYSEKMENEKNKNILNNLLISLPSGYIYGQNVNNIISSYTVGYQDDMRFIDLPIPFICISTDLVSSKSKVWYSGKLTTALRSTMSIPGIFSPVKIEGMVLVDGGMTNNYPCDLAKSLGVDVVIGVDLSSGYLQYNKINNLGDVILQGLKMLGREQYEKTRKYADITIKPDLRKYGMMSFDKESVDTIINKGYLAAKEVEKELDSLKYLCGRSKTVFNGAKAVNLGDTSIFISDVIMKGISYKDAEYLKNRINVKAGKPYDKYAVEDAVAQIYSTGAFDYVSYELLGTSQPYRISFNCKRGPINQVGLGFRADTEDVVSLLFNLGINTHSLRVHSLDFTCRLGINPYGMVHYYYNLPTGATLNLKGKLKWTDRNKFMYRGNLYNMAYMNFVLKSYFSNINWKYFDLNMGLKLNNTRLHSATSTTVLSEKEMSSMTNTFFSLFLKADHNSLDNTYFPYSGVTIRSSVDWIFKGMKDISPFYDFNLSVKTVIGIKRRFAVEPDFHLRFLIGEEIPFSYYNVIGGYMNGRYLEHQIPFDGLKYSVLLPNYLVVAGMKFRYEVFRNHFVAFSCSYSHSFDKPEYFMNPEKFNQHVGFNLEYGYKSAIGPIRCNFGWANVLNKAGMYCSIGYDF